MRPAWRRTTVALALAAATLSVTSCVNLSQLAFRQDHRLHFQSPQHRALTKTPVTVSWRMDGFRIAAPGSEPPTKGAGYFAIFVDRAPIKPGQTLAAVAHGDTFCLASKHCPDRHYLAQRQVYFTTHYSMTLHTVLPLAGNKDSEQLHDITIVLMDTDGRRIGESSWFEQFKLRRIGVTG